ncbi:putative methyltransferase PMT27 [Hordeum vulgare]|nr:putative methyltransferase PMT27 [Hordeum vulgare]
MALPMSPMTLPAADDDNKGKFTTHHIVDTHVRGKDLLVVYMNESVSVERSIQTMEQLLHEDKYQVVNFNLEFTSDCARQDQKNLVNICDTTRSGATPITNITPLVDLALAIIDPYYMKMKDERKKDKDACHYAWDQRLDEECVKYAVKESYTSYEMYRHIVDMRKCLRPSPDEGLSHIVVAGVSQEVDD